jgi:hypothetical protein
MNYELRRRLRKAIASTGACLPSPRKQRRDCQQHPGQEHQPKGVCHQERRDFRRRTNHWHRDRGDCNGRPDVLPDSNERQDQCDNENCDIWSAHGCHPPFRETATQQNAARRLHSTISGSSNIQSAANFLWISELFAWFTCGYWDYRLPRNLPAPHCPRAPLGRRQGGTEAISEPVRRGEVLSGSMLLKKSAGSYGGATIESLAMTS